YLVSNPLSGASTSTAVYRLLGTMIGGVMSVILLPNLVNAPELMALAMASWVGFCLFVSFLDRSPRSYTMMLAGYTALIISFRIVDTPEEIFLVATDRVQEIGLGVICAALVNRLILPVHAGPILFGRVNAWLGNAGRLAADTLRGH
ncbi:FUSC family protein, partial [Thioclava sp. BHET1]